MLTQIKHRHTGAVLHEGEGTTAQVLQAAIAAGANLSGASGLLSSAEWLQQFKATADGIIVYKTFGYMYSPPKSWEIKPNSVITEVPNPCQTMGCGCGVNFATPMWIQHNTSEPVWECLIRWVDLADVVVPYNTDGKARCGRMTLLRKIPPDEWVQIVDEWKARERAEKGVADVE